MKQIVNYRLFVVAATLLFSFSNINAAVTIGSTAAPKGFSVLELIGCNLDNGNSNPMGFRLPQLTREQRDELTEMIKILPADCYDTRAWKDLARGLMIFNLCTRCTETWNGSVWTASCF